MPDNLAQSTQRSHCGVAGHSTCDCETFAFASLEVGLLIAPAERRRALMSPAAKPVRSPQSDLERRIAKCRHSSRISRGKKQEFSEDKTDWRRGRDSNPRYRC